MHADLPAVNELMTRVAKDLHLRPHVTGQYEGFTVQIPFPADIEGHVGDDRRFYLLDFARIMPPTAPVTGTTLRSQYLFRLFRPEFLKNYKKALSPGTICTSLVGQAWSNLVCFTRCLFEL